MQLRRDLSLSALPRWRGRRARTQLISLRSDPVNRELLGDLMKSLRDRCRQLDPAQGASKAAGWAWQWCSITDLRLRNTHDQVAPKFQHGPHAGKRVEDLVQSYMRGEDKPKWLTPLVAARWRRCSGVVFGTRRMWALLEYRRRHEPWTGKAPQVRVIVHDYPFDRIEPAELRLALTLKAIDAMSIRFRLPHPRSQRGRRS